MITGDGRRSRSSSETAVVKIAVLEELFIWINCRIGTNAFTVFGKIFN